MTDQDIAIVAMTTCPTPEAAEQMAQILVNEGLAACVSSVGGVTSTYRWQGQTRSDAEVLLMIKTTMARFDELKARLLALHSYELPELIALPVCAASEPYLNWVRQTVAPR